MRSATDWQSAKPSCMNCACALQNSNGEWQRANRVGSSSAALLRRVINASTLESRPSATSAFPREAVLPVLQFLIASGIARNIERFVLRPRRLPGSPTRFG